MIPPCPLQDCPREPLTPRAKDDIQQGETTGETHLRGLAHYRVQGNNVLGCNKLRGCYGEESEWQKGGIVVVWRIMSRRELRDKRGQSVPLSGHGLHPICPVCSLNSVQLHPWVEAPYCCWQTNRICGLGERHQSRNSLDQIFLHPYLQISWRSWLLIQAKHRGECEAGVHCETCLHVCVCVPKA